VIRSDDALQGRQAAHHARGYSTTKACRITGMGRVAGVGRFRTICAARQ
jgi:hypothetical protein